MSSERLGHKRDAALQEASSVGNKVQNLNLRTVLYLGSGDGDGSVEAGVLQLALTFGHRPKHGREDDSSHLLTKCITY